MLNALRTDNSPFSEEQLQLLKQSIGALDAGQSQWLSGYLAGALATGNLETAPAVAAEGAEPLTILFGSETGNGEVLAETFAERARVAGQVVKIQSLDGFRPAQLKKVKNAVFVMSTHGEGDPPEEAIDLFEFLDSPRAPKLENLNYRILALGDRSYEQFCEAGRRLDRRLEALGASRFGDTLECDVDYNAESETFGEEVLEWARENLSAGTAASSTAHLSVVPAIPQWTRQNPWSGEVTRIQRITAEASDKDVCHVELSLEGSGLNYQPGDALGIWAPNDPELVRTVTEGVGLDGEENIEWDGEKLSLTEVLTEHKELTRLSNDTVKDYAAASGRSDLAELFDALGAEERRTFLEQRQFADLVTAYPANLHADQLLEILRPLGSRSYSIASSQNWAEDEVHLTVATLESNALGVQRQGVASQFLNHRLNEGDPVRLFLEPNRRFHLPETRDVPLIMIGAGTGVAPFRAFIQELEASDFNPDTWLIFGNPHQRTDFLYQREFLKWRDSKLLNRIDAAWSRDQEEKRYVQHIVREQAERIDLWLQAGAHIYVCGGLDMGQAVQDELQHGLARVRGLDEAAAAEVVNELRRSKRLHKDLY